MTRFLQWCRRSDRRLPTASAREPLLACGHQACDNHLLDGKCGTCAMIAAWQGMADDENNSDELRGACRRVVDMFKDGHMYYCHDGATLFDLMHWPMSFEREHKEMSARIT